MDCIVGNIFYFVHLDLEKKTRAGAKNGPLSEEKTMLILVQYEKLEGEFIVH